MKPLLMTPWTLYYRTIAYPLMRKKCSLCQQLKGVLALLVPVPLEVLCQTSGSSLLEKEGRSIPSDRQFTVGLSLLQHQNIKWRLFLWKNNIPSSESSSLPKRTWTNIHFHNTIIRRLCWCSRLAMCTQISIVCVCVLWNVCCLLLQEGPLFNRWVSAGLSDL